MTRLIGAEGSAISAAKRGDKEAAKQIARYIADDLEAGKPLSPVAHKYLVDGLRQIAAGMPGNRAFHTSGKKGRPIDDGNLIRNILLAARVQALINEGISENAASGVVAGAFHRGALDKSTVRKIFREHAKPWMMDVDPDLLGLEDL